MKKILIIDDYKPLLEEIVEFLKFEGYNAIAAKNGAEGVQKAQDFLPDLIICDINMPKIDGYQVYKVLQTFPETINIPFIFLTAKVQTEDFKKGLRLGVDDYITKPFKIEEILNSIEKRIQKYDRLKNINKPEIKTHNISLTKREYEVLELICKGLTNNEISEMLFISNRTVGNHRANILLKTDTKNTANLVAFAIKNNFVK